jgi:formiminotetrahydrofolate cyclodeaminase
VEERPELLKLGVGDFLAALAAQTPAPGGGSAAAVTVAMAAALVRSVASLSREGWSEAGGVIAQAEAVGRRVTPLIQRDAHAYEDALRTIAERSEIAPEDREARLADSLERAAAAPLEIGEAAAEAAELAALAVENGEPSVRADAAAAAMLAEAAARVSATLVEINLGAGPSDPRVEAAQALVARATSGRQRAASALAG